jgi:hypothetical protein
MNFRIAAVAASLATVLGASAAAQSAPQPINVPGTNRQIVQPRTISVQRTQAAAVNERRFIERRTALAAEERNESCAAVLNERSDDIDSRAIADLVQDRRAQCIADRRGDRHVRQLRRDDRRDDRQINQFRTGRDDRPIPLVRSDDRRDDRTIRRLRDARRDDRLIRHLRRDDRTDDRQINRLRHIDRRGGHSVARVSAPRHIHRPGG